MSYLSYTVVFQQLPVGGLRILCTPSNVYTRLSPKDRDQRLRRQKQKYPKLNVFLFRSYTIWIFLHHPDFLKHFGLSELAKQRVRGETIKIKKINTETGETKKTGSKHAERKECRTHENWFQEHRGMNIPCCITTYFFMKKEHSHLSNNKAQGNTSPYTKEREFRMQKHLINRNQTSKGCCPFWRKTYVKRYSEHFISISLN